MIFDELFESNNKPIHQLDESAMDRLKNIYMGLVYDTPMGTPDSEFLAQWQQEIRNELGQNIDINTLAKLKQNFRDRYKTMSDRGDVRDWHREMGMNEQDVEEAKHFRTAYGWAGGYNEKTGKKYKHPEQIKQDREARKQQKPQEKQPEVKEGVNAKQIKKDLDSGMSYDAVIGKHANKRLTNTDEIRRVIQQHAWEKRMKRPKEQGVAEGLPSHIKKSDVPPAMRSKLTMRDVEAERPQSAFRFRVGDKEFMDLAAAQSFAQGTGETVKPIREVKKKLGERGATRSARIERILKMLRARNPQAQDDLEALLLNYRADQAHDQAEIDRLDAENDQEEADIANLQQAVQRRMAEQAALSKFRTREHPSFQIFAESWHRAHGGV